MTCDCYKEIEKRWEESEQYSKTDFYNSLVYSFFSDKGFHSYLGCWIEVVEKGKKRKSKRFMLFDYCPICGKKLKEKEK